MEFVKKLFGRGQSLNVVKENCPNCWGRQEYLNQILESSSRENIDLNNINRKKGWIVGYVEKHFIGLSMR